MSLARRLLHDLVSRIGPLSLLLLTTLGANARLDAQTPMFTVTGRNADDVPPGAEISVSFSITNNWSTVQSISYATPNCSGDIVGGGGDEPVYCWLSSMPGLSFAPHETKTFAVAVQGPYDEDVAIASRHVSLSITVSSGGVTATFNGAATIYSPRRARVTDIQWPVRGTTIDVPPNTSYTLFVTLTDTGPRSFVAHARADCGQFVYPGTTWCGWTNGADTIFDNKRWVELDADSGISTGQLSFWTGAPGTRGYVRILVKMPDSNTGLDVVDTVSVIVRSGDQIMPAVWPKGQARSAVPNIVHVDTFTVVNTGSSTALYTFAPSCGSFATNGCTAAPTSATIAAGDSTHVRVTYQPGAANGATTAIKLVASASATGGFAEVDSGFVGVTSADNAAPTITITPASGSTLTTQSIPAVVNLCDNGTVGHPVVRFNGAVLPDMFIPSLQAGCTSAGTATYALQAQPGTNTITVIANDVFNTDTLTRTFSYDDAAQVTPQVKFIHDLILHPAPKVPLATAWADSFTVKNPGPLAATYTTSATCGAFGSCVAQPSTLSIPAGGTAVVAVAYTTPASAGQSGTIQFTAAHTSATGHTVFASASVTESTAGGVPTLIAMTPADGSTYGSPSLSATVTWCDPDDAIASHTVTLGGLVLANTYRDTTIAGCVRAGVSSWTNVTLEPWDQLLLAEAVDAAGHISRVGHVVRYAASVAAFAPRVTPKNTSRVVPGVGVFMQTFTVANAGAYAATYQLTPRCGTLTACSADKTSLTLAAGAQDSARVSYLVPSGMSTVAPIQLVASLQGSGAIADTGQVMTHTPTASDMYRVRVTGSPTPILMPPTWGHSVSYLVTNLGSAVATYRIVVTTTNGFTISSGPTAPPATITLGPGATTSFDTYVMSPNVNNLSGTVIASATATALDGSTTTDTSTTQVGTTTDKAGVKVTALSKRITVSPGAYSFDVSFRVQNTSTSSLQESISLNTVGSCFVPTECTGPNGVVLSAGASATVLFTKKYLRHPHADTLILLGSTSLGPTSTSSSADTVYLSDGNFRAVAVSPNAATHPVLAGPTPQFFEIRNDGSGPASFYYKAACAGDVFVSCGFPDSLITGQLDAGAIARVSVPQVASAILGKVGTITLRASDSSDPSVVASGVITVTRANVAPIAVSVDAAGATPTIAKAQCLTIAAASDAAYECGNLRLVHALPATSTMNKARTPTLIFDSRQLNDIVLFPADINISAGQVSSVTARVVIGADTVGSRSFPWDASWSGSATYRIVVPVDARAKSLATGVYPYTLVVSANSNGGPIAAQATGTVAIVNRVGSQFGAGWWLDGFEQLIPVTSDSTKRFWIGGDGSTRLYSRIGPVDSKRWNVQPTVDRPDSLTWSGGFFYRWLRNGAYVKFDNLGRHVATVNAQGHQTSFRFNTAKVWLLDTIALPVPSGSSAGRLYLLAHDDSGRLVRVDAPRNPTGPVRSTSIGHGYANATFVVTSITDPDTSTVQFGYDAAGRVSTRTDRRGYVTQFDYDEGQALKRSTLHMGSTATYDIARYFCAAETASLAQCANDAIGPVDTASVMTRVDGPRTDIPDTTWFHVTRYGAPSVVVDALHQVTTLVRGDTRWPFLVTSTISPNGFTTTAAYNTRGLIVSRTSLSPLGTNQNAATTYVWNDTARLDLLDRVVGPSGETVRFGYFANGDRQWHEDGRGSMSRAWFTYTGSRLLSSVQTPGNTSSQVQRFEYDSTGTGNLRRDTSPLGAVSRYHVDAIGQVDSVYTPLADGQWRTQGFGFDLQGRTIVQRDSGPAVAYSAPDGPHTTPAVTLAVTTEYDREGNPVSVTRQSIPNLANAANPLTLWTYDGLGRKLTAHSNSGRQESWAYDQAGNVTVRTPPRGGAVTTTYDMLNRPTRRVTTAVSRLATEGTRDDACSHVPRFPYYTPGYMYEPIAESNCGLGTQLPPNLIIAGDTSDFGYDAVGNVLFANNGTAHVARTYFPGGWLASETERVGVIDELGDYVGDRFATHVYTLRFSYDLSGRRVARTDNVPTCGVCVQTHEYDPSSGLLAATTDTSDGRARARFAFGYDGQGRISTWTVNGNRVVNDQTFDADGRVTGRSIIGAGTTIYQDGLGYDPMGRVTSTMTTSNLPGIEDNTLQVYNGLGALASVSRTRGGAMADEYTTDAMGNRVRDRRWLENTTISHASTYEVERLVGVSTTPPHWVPGDPTPPAAQQTIDNVVTDYDGAGNEEYSYKTVSLFVGGSYGWVPSPIGREWTWHAYSSDDRLAVSQRSYVDPAGHMRTVFSDYHYDALGRRVFLRTRWDQYCQTSAPSCLSVTERTIWDGNQTLMEMRSPAASEADATSGAFMGAVRYTFAGGVDDPLAVWKSDIGGVVPHRSWRGTYEAGTGVTTATSNVSWPARTQDLFRASDERFTPIAQTEWLGSIVEGRTDPSGLQYMRNRYYDPKSGRFTQEDPIGLGGGMNLYGFASGDPVNFSDPFGLCGRKGEEPCPTVDDLKQQQTMLEGLKSVGDFFAVGKFFELLVEGGASTGVGQGSSAKAPSVEVIHFTSAEGAAAIEESGALRAGSFVALPGEVAGKNAGAIESLLEVGPGRGAMSARFKVSPDALKLPFNGSKTTGGAIQFQLTRPIPLKPGSFVSTP